MSPALGCQLYLTSHTRQLLCRAQRQRGLVHLTAGCVNCMMSVSGRAEGAFADRRPGINSGEVECL